jgi:hypothetical protein
MKHINPILEPDGVYRPIGVAPVILNDLKDTRAEPFERFGRRMFVTVLCDT